MLADPAHPETTDPAAPFGPGLAAPFDPAFADDAPAPVPRAAGVLVPLVVRAGVPHVLFTRRAATLPSHRGEISFPGGARDPEDRTLVETALREAWEELGIPRERVRVLGVLAPVFTVVSNFLITPVVGWLGDEPLGLTPNPGEVDDVIEAPLAALADPAIFHAERWVRLGHSHDVYFYDFGTVRIWGATGRILHQFLNLLPR
jgi:8-oxo-dGTP pyrophosphatase MutT (NUDIX family)